MVRLLEYIPGAIRRINVNSPSHDDNCAGFVQLQKVQHPGVALTLTHSVAHPCYNMSGRRDARPVVLGAELRLPRPGTDRLPAVVLLHASGGPGALEDQWAREFATLGVAALIIDGFTARGVTNTSEAHAAGVKEIREFVAQVLKVN